MSDQMNFSLNIDPHFRQSLSSEQLMTLEKIERLTDLDPEVTQRLARALDRLQRTQPYQQLNQNFFQNPTQSEPLTQPVSLSDAEQAAHEEFVSTELATLLAVAGQLNQIFETNRPQAQADRHFREQLRAQFK